MSGEGLIGEAAKGMPASTVPLDGSAVNSAMWGESMNSWMGVGTQLAGIINGFLQQDFQVKMMRAWQGLENRKLDIQERVFDHRAELENTVVEMQGKAVMEKMSLTRDLAKISKDYGIEVAKIKADAKVQIAGKLAIRNFFMQSQRNYGQPVSVSV